MPYFIWTEADLGLKITQMDREHQVLIDSMNRIYDLNAAEASRTQIIAEIEHLIALTERHFKNEEYYMDMIGYPDLGKHRLIHENLLNRLQDYFEEFENGDGGVGDGFFRFLQVWLTAHIIGIDRHYAAHAHALQDQA